MEKQWIWKENFWDEQNNTFSIQENNIVTLPFKIQENNYKQKEYFSSKLPNYSRIPNVNIRIKMIHILFDTNSAFIHLSIEIL